MNYVDAFCSPCGHAFRWLSGTPLRCPVCQQLICPEPVLWGQDRQQTARWQSTEGGSGDGAENGWTGSARCTNRQRELQGVDS